jgi:hypothetical protein
MSISRALLAAFCLTSLILTGCSKSSSSSSSGQMRVVNAFSQANALDVSVNAKPVVSGLQFQSNSQYTDVDSGAQAVIVSVTGVSTALVNTTSTWLNTGTATSSSDRKRRRRQLVADSFAIRNGTSPRLINGAPGPGLDLRHCAGADLGATHRRRQRPLRLKQPFHRCDRHKFRNSHTPAGTKDVIYDGVPQTFAEHSGATIVALGKGSGKLVNVVLLREDDTGSGALVDNLLTQYKVVNASLVPSPLNVIVDGALQLSNIPIGRVELSDQHGTHNFSFEATTTPGASLLTLVQTLTAATDISIVLTGTAGALHPLVLQDNNLPPPVSTANVRFVNSSADVAAFDVFVNFSKQVSGLLTNSASGYINLSAAASTGTSYEFDFNLAGTTTSLLKLTSVVLTAGRTYTVYLTGPSSSLRGVVSQDN